MKSIQLQVIKGKKIEEMPMEFEGRQITVQIYDGFLAPVQEAPKKK